MLKLQEIAKNNVMKGIRLIVTMMLLCVTIEITAQVTVSDLKIKAKKERKHVRDESRRLKRDGWMPFHGKLPIDRQLDRFYMMSYEIDSNKQSKFMFAESWATNQFYDAAKQSAIEFAKNELIDRLYTEITQDLKAQVMAKSLSEEQIQRMWGILEKSKAMFSQRLSSFEPVVELYQKNKNGIVEVMVRYAYNREKAKQEVIKYIEEKQQGSEL